MPRPSKRSPSIAGCRADLAAKCWALARSALLCLPFLWPAAGASGAEAAVAPMEAGSLPATVTVEGDRARFVLRGADGEQVYDWSAPGRRSAGWLGEIVLTERGRRALVWSAGPGPAWTSPGVRRISAVWTRTAGDAARLSLTYRLEGRPIRLDIAVTPQGKALVLTLTCDRPLISELDLGGWRLPGDVRMIAVPYDPFATRYIPGAGLFTSAYFDWTDSRATRQDGSRVEYQAWTDGRRNSLRDRFVIAVSRHLREVLPRAPHGRSRYFDRVAGRLIIHVVRAEPFAAIAAQLAELGRAGLRDCGLVVDSWQHDGYDDGLPLHAPANDRLGGDAGMKALAATAEGIGCELYLHQNYTDYYRDFPGFDEAEVARDGEGAPIKAWFNRSAGAQSYYLKPELAEKYARIEGAKIVSLYRTPGSFLDVVSSFYPWTRVDMDAASPVPGRFEAFYRSGAALFSTLQEIYRGPVLGEGHAHFFWTGLLDAVEAQVTVGYGGDGGGIPLLVDFDLLRMHDKQANYGMGFYSRWNRREAEIDHVDWARLPIETDPVMRDLYRMQEIAFGHDPTLTGVAWWNQPAFAEEAGLAAPLARRYASSRVEGIAYLVDGRWVGADEAAAEGRTSVVRVTYRNGLTIVANGSRTPLAADGLTLPPGGWSAHGAGVAAFRAARRGWRIGYAAAPELIFADGRRIVPAEAGATPAPPSGLVDFGTVRTDGLILIERREDGLHLWAPEGQKPVTLLLRGADFPALTGLSCGAGPVTAGEEEGYRSLRLAAGQLCVLIAAPRRSSSREE